MDTMEFESVIGLEVHVQLKTNTKIFCGCRNEFGATPNSHTCPVCLGMPGVLPVLNKKVAEFAVRCGLATDCTINRESRFDRKNYFYPDLPKGYQITQFEYPVAEFGHLDIEMDTDSKRIGITRIHIEEDAGKLTHDPDRPLSMVDLNRAGTPLLEIVSEPDMRTPLEAGKYLRKLHSIVKYIGVCDGNMQEGSFRCDANVSIMPKGSREFGTRSELKNLNSFKFLEKAIAYEISRQKHVILEGGKVVQETRLWDPVKGRSFSMRGKENAHDYRYFPEPDLLPLVIDSAWIDEIRNSMPELPDAKRERFSKQYDLNNNDLEIIIASSALADYFEISVMGLEHPKRAGSFITGIFLSYLNTNNMEPGESPVTPESVNALLKLTEKGLISSGIAKTVFENMVLTGDDPETVIENKGLSQVSDTGEIDGLIDQIISDNPKEALAFRNGKSKLMGFFVGQVMKQTKGKANPKVVNERLMDKLGV